MGLEEYSGIELEAYTIKIAIECSDSGTGPVGDIYIEDILDWPTQGFSLSDHAHAGVYEPADAGIQSHILNNSIHLSTEKQEYWDAKADISDVDQAEADAKAYTDTEISGLSTVYSSISHTHPGIYEPANSNIQVHIADGDPHVTPSQKTTWDNKASTAYADQAEADANAYTDTEIAALSSLYSAIDHTHEGIYEPANANIQSHISDTSVHVTPTNKSDWDGKAEPSYVDQAEADAKAYTDTEISGLSTVYSPLSHTHPGVYEPANANIQSHISDTNIHVTLSNKSTWDAKADISDVTQAENNAKAYTDSEISDLSAVYSPLGHTHDGVYEPADVAIQGHIADTDIHVESSDKTAWDAKAETSYVDQAEADAKAYTDSEISGLSSVYLPLFVSTRIEATTFSLSDSDNGNYIQYTGSSNIDVTVENTISIGVIITIWQGGTGVVTLVPGSGVSLHGSTDTNGQYSVISLIKTADGEFDIISSTTGSGTGDIYISNIIDWPSQGFSLSDHEHAGVYEPANSNIQAHIADSTIHVTSGDKSTWNAKASTAYVDQAEADAIAAAATDATTKSNAAQAAANAYTDTEISDLSSVYSPISHNHDGSYEPANSNIQGHISDSDIHVTLSDKSTWNAKASVAYVDQAEADANAYTDTQIAGLSSVYAVISHNHDGIYEPANANIQTHIADSNIHVTTGDKSTWNGKAETSYVDQAESDANDYTDSVVTGLSSVYEPKNTNIQTHISDNNIHVTTGDKSTWNAKAETSYVDQAETDANTYTDSEISGLSSVYSPVSHNHDGTYEPANSNIQTHISNTDIHVTTGDKSTWNNKADTSYVDQAETDANGYTDTEIAGLSTVYEPKNTNIQTHISNGNIHVTQENKNVWDAKADAYAVTREESTSFTIDDTDNGDYIRYTGTSNFNLDIDNTLTIGTIISIRQANSGVITFVPGSGTPTLNGDTTTNGLHSLTQIIKVADGVFDIVTINDTLSDSSLGVENITFTQSIPFDKQLSIINVTQDADYEFIPNTTGAVEGYRTRATITGDSSHSVIFTDFVKSGGSLDYDNTKTNSIIFWKEGDIYFYRIYEQVEYTGGSGAPAISDSNRIFPGAVGFGTDDKGAYEGSSTPTILICDSLANTETQTGTDRGTFRWCVAQAYPRIILFEVSGVIDCTDVNWRIKVSNPYMNIYGQTAPGKGITLKGIVFWIETSHILIQHMRILPGDESSLIPGSDVDALDIYGAQTDVVIDHCTLGWSVDECSSPDATASNITYSNCLFKEPFDQSTHYDEHSSSVWAERHPYCSLGQAENITYYRNCFCYSYGRNPLINGNHAQIINNYVYATRWAPPMVGANNMHVDIVGNVIETFEQTGWSTHVHAVYVLDGLDASTLLYVDDNICDNAGATDWDNVYNNSNVTQSMTELNSSSGFNILAASQVKASILANCGAFYWNRDATDAEVIAKIQNDTGAPMRNSADNYPATARNMEGTATTGDMSSGHDWSSGNQTLVLSYNETAGGGIVGPYTYTLTANCADIDAVIAHINNVLPSAFLVCERIGGNTPIPTDNVCIRTTHAANSSFIEVHSSGTGHETLGIAAGTFYGQTNTPWDTSSDSDSLSVPANPHNDDDSNTYTNIEEWVYEMGYPGGESEAVAEKWLGSLAAMNVWKGTAAEWTALGTYDNNTMYLIEEV